MRKKLLNWAAHRIMKHYKVPTDHELLDNLTDKEVKEYSAQAKAILQYPYFRWFLQDMQLNAERIMYSKAETDEVWWFAKGMMYAIDVSHKNINTLATAEQRLVDSKEKKSMSRFR